MRVFFIIIILALFAPTALAQPPQGSQPVVDELAGIYVQCPRKNEDKCHQAREDFRMVFPNGQPHPYLMIREGGVGYLAPDDKLTIDFVIEEKQADVMILKMSDRNKKKLELRRRGDIWRDKSSGELYIKAIEDADWNVPPEPFKNKQKKAAKK